MIPLKNSMFLMLVLLHITSQPAQPLTASDAVAGLGALAIGSVGFIAFSKLYTHFKKKERRIPISTEDKMRKWHYAHYEVRIMKKHGLGSDSCGRYGFSAMQQMVYSRWRFFQRQHHDIFPLWLSCDAHRGEGETATLRPAHTGEEERRITISGYEWHDAYRVEGKIPKLRHAHIDNGAKEKSDIHARDENGQTAIQRMVWRGNREEVTRLIAEGADVNSKNEWENTLLYCALCNNDRDMVTHLIDNGADLDHQDKWGFPLLYFAICICDLKMVRHLIDSGADVSLQDKLGFPLLHFAINSGLTDIVECLIAEGANVNHKDKWGFSLLHDAVRGGNPAMVACLIDNGANIGQGDAASCLEMFYQEHRIRKNKNKRKYSQDQFKKDLQEDGWFERTEQESNRIEWFLYGRLPKELNTYISEFLVSKSFSDTECVQIAARQHLKEEILKLHNQNSEVMHDF